MAAAVASSTVPAGGLLSSSSITALRRDTAALRSKLGYINDFLDLLSSSFALARLAPGASWSTADQQQFSTIEETLGVVHGANDAIQTGCGLTQLLTGGMFFKTQADGSFQVDTSSNKRVLFSPLSVLSKVTRLASKMLGTVKFMGSPVLPVYQLGSHARGLGLSSLAFGTVSSAFDVAENTREVCATLTTKDKCCDSTQGNSFMERFKRARAGMFALLCSVFDLLAQAFCFVCETVSNAFMGVHTAFIVGIFCFLSALGNVLLIAAS
ncbi:hypothetical protein C6H88_04695 [Chlamydia muridarum str. Nigg]|uniref:Uncharacterized protein n=2 Tax=Chlamydia muridarum TaxID=83560 RepID=A0A069ZTR5_CHLMR|nr:hypothetical protein [Chlamydia muridarum]UFT42450.1 hypothetical protein FTN53_04840 [Chlamydia trachomatis]AAF39701.1 conserved hypothetical protein [Chlamydia muridarum str. Nigg]AHH23296.1 hypothetical protein TAC_04820 [Chlamydia muridarum str. Nigg3 CMUT3-5]AHH24223.1 hypothetical protein Y015_04820 [Chlamydia muridarum str. Nigg CM972]AID38420.1 hypothetical protein BB17_04870 [Chlamydia muridarum str. Nigg 2 MCR]